MKKISLSLIIICLFFLSCSDTQSDVQDVSSSIIAIIGNDGSVLPYPEDEQGFNLSVSYKLRGSDYHEDHTYELTGYFTNDDGESIKVFSELINNQEESHSVLFNYPRIDIIDSEITPPYKLYFTIKSKITDLIIACSEYQYYDEPDIILASNIIIPSSIEVDQGDKVRINAIIEPDNVNYGEIAWGLSNVCIPLEELVITGKYGENLEFETTAIEATFEVSAIMRTENGLIQATCLVYVR